MRTRPAGQYITEREAEVLNWLIHGFSYRDVADRMSISRRTVQAHVWHMRKRLGITGPKSKVLLFTWWKENGGVRVK